MKYVLFSCMDRHIFKPMFFDTKDSAHYTMCSYIDELLGYDPDHVKSLYDSEKDEFGVYETDKEFGVSEDGAYINDEAEFCLEDQKGNWDFEIFECEK